MEELILKSAEDCSVVRDQVFNAMGEFLVIRILCKMGNRPEILGNMTWADFWTADARGHAVYPFNQASANAQATPDPENPTIYKTRSPGARSK